MATHVAALLFRPEIVSDRALAQGFAVALAGWDAPAPRLEITSLPGIPGWSAAFYASGAKLPRGAEDEELDHARALFEDELPPALAVLDAVTEEGREGAVLYAIVRSEAPLHDDAWRVDPQGFSRYFVREGDDGLEAGVESAEEGTVEEIDPDEAEIGPRRGSTFLSVELGARVVPALMGALFAVDRRVPIRLVDPSPAAIEAETRRLDRALGRTAGRGAFELPAVAGVAPPDAVTAFARAYDWADPSDPGDAYRELSIGRVEGTLRFLREADLRALDTDAAFAAAAKAGVYPLARLGGSALGGAGAPKGVIGIAANRDDLVIVGPKGDIVSAGPTFGELIRYLALGWSKRTEAEEDMIEALMLRAKVRAA